MATLVTGLFRSRASAERAVEDLVHYGWPRDDISLLMSDATRGREFGLSMVTLSFTMLYLGGIGTIWGPIIGAVIVSMLPEAFRGLKELQDIAYAAVLILILIFFPKGLAALPGMIARWRAHKAQAS